MNETCLNGRISHMYKRFLPHLGEINVNSYAADSALASWYAATERLYVCPRCGAMLLRIGQITGVMPLKEIERHYLPKPATWIFA